MDVQVEEGSNQMLGVYLHKIHVGAREWLKGVFMRVLVGRGTYSYIYMYTNTVNLSKAAIQNRKKTKVAK